MKVEMGLLGSPVPYSLYGLCGRKATLNSNLNIGVHGTQELCEEGGGAGSSLVARWVNVNVLLIRVVLKPVLNWTNVCSPEHTSNTSTNYDSFLN